jgi:sugar phosphate isomerase/epimerase
VVVMEINRRFTLKTVSQGAHFLQRLGRSDVQLQLDSLHFFRLDGDIQHILLYRSFIGRCQLADGPTTVTPGDQVSESRTGRLIPGEGEFQLAAFVRALPMDIVVAAEVPNKGIEVGPRVLRTLSAIRKLLEEDQVRRDA